jgi:aminopeptidase N
MLNTASCTHAPFPVTNACFPGEAEDSSPEQENIMWTRLRIIRARVATAAAAATITLATALTPGTAWGADCEAGASGVGDVYYPLYGNGGYDVQHYLLNLTYDPATDQLTGEAVILARATTTLCRFNLDLQGLNVRSVLINGASAAWSRSDDHELTITPPHRLKTDRLFTVIVRYDGVPRTQFDPETNRPSGWIHTDDGAAVMGEPEGAANWFPVNDHPTDKATFTLAVTVPAGLVAMGNGRLLGRLPAPHNRTTWIWHAAEPMAPYLATVSLGQFNLRAYRTPGGLPMYDAVDPDLYSLPVNAQDPSSPTFGQVIDGSLARQGEILDFLARLFGPYPFSSAGAIVDDSPDLFFALENQTRPNYSHKFFTNSILGDLVVVHENAHQWFGDSVSVHEWQHIWLNEGFATYAEWLWFEHQGLNTAQRLFEDYYALYPEDDAFWSVAIGDPGIPDLFHRAVYRRGAMTLQVLRNQVGDANFFAISRAWATRKAGGNGTTAEFVALAEQISGQQLDELFQTWLFTPGKPAAAVAGAAAGSATATSTRMSPGASGLPERMPHGAGRLER